MSLTMTRSTATLATTASLRRTRSAYASHRVLARSISSGPSSSTPDASLLQPHNNNHHHHHHSHERLYHKHSHLLPQNYHLHKVKKYIQDGKPLASPAAASNLSEQFDGKPPVAVVFGWMGAKQRHLNKMIEYYNFKGMDAVSYTPTPRDVLQPEFGRSQIRKLLEFLLESNVNSLFHCFSTGGYMYGQALSLMQSESLTHLHELPKTVRASIFDSVVDESGVREGIPKALFPNNPLQQSIARTTVGFILSNFRSVSDALKHASAVFHNNNVKSPSLWLYSKDDDIADHATITRVINKWKARGLDCHAQLWEVSKHVSHAKVHPMQYFSTLDSFLQTALQLPLASQEAIFEQFVATIQADKHKRAAHNHTTHQGAPPAGMKELNEIISLANRSSAPTAHIPAAAASSSSAAVASRA